MASIPVGVEVRLAESLRPLYPTKITYGVCPMGPYVVPKATVLLNARGKMTPLMSD